MIAKKILVMVDGNWLAHTSRPLEIAKVLRKMGHEIIFAGGGEYMKLPGEANFPVVPLKSIEPNKLLERIRRGRANWYDYQTLKEFVEEDLKLFKKIKPDLILGDARLSVSTSCKAAKIPLAVILNASWTNHYAVKIRGIEHSRIGQFVRKTMGKRTAMRLGLAERIKKLILILDSSPFRKLRKEMRLPSCKNLWEAMEGDLNLLCDIPEYAPTKNLPPNFHYIGPIIWKPDSNLPDWLNQLSSDRPTLYFTMGSTGYPRFFQEAIEIFGDTKFQCVMTTGKLTKIDERPENFFVTDYAPGSEIMEKSNVVICHGGNGTIYQAMSQGVPIIGIPTMHDQEFNMQRVVDLGIGVQLNEIGFKPSYLIRAIEEILAEKSYQEKAQRFKKILANYHGPQKGAELINDYLS